MARLLNSEKDTLVRKLVEDYHERLEEKYLFPEFDKAKKLADLVQVLKEQHEAGRKVTEFCEATSLLAIIAGEKVALP